MDKLDSTQINDVLKDVRSSYRLIALYQKRLLDIVKYVANGYNVSFNSGWSKFSNAASNGNRANINNWSWDWLSLYLYEFNLGGIEIENDRYNLKIVHQADTGYYDANEDKKISKQNVDQFADSSVSSTRLFFVISKNDNGCPIKNILKDNLKAQDNTKIVNGNWLAIPYDLERFSSQESTDLVLDEFDNECKSTFGVNILTKNNLDHYEKKELIKHINQNYNATLNASNTSYSNINKSKNVWWFNVPVNRFTEVVHLLLNAKEYVLWVVLPKGFDESTLFRIRKDKGDVADLEISADKNFKYLQDVKSGGTGFDFSGFVKEEIFY